MSLFDSIRAFWKISIASTYLSHTRQQMRLDASETASEAAAEAEEQAEQQQQQLTSQQQRAQEARKESRIKAEERKQLVEETYSWLR